MGVYEFLGHVSVKCKNTNEIEGRELVDERNLQVLEGMELKCIPDFLIFFSFFGWVVNC